MRRKRLFVDEPELLFLLFEYEHYTVCLPGELATSSARPKLSEILLASLLIAIISVGITISESAQKKVTKAKTE